MNKFLMSVGYCFICLLLLGSSACSQHVAQSDYLALTDSVSMQTIAITPEILMPTNMFVSGNHLVVYQRIGETLFVVYPLPIGVGDGFEAGFTGRGPDDFLGVDVHSFKSCADGFMVADNGGVVKTVVIDPGRVRVTDRKQISTNGDPQNGMIELKDCYVNMNQANEKEEFVLYDKLGGNPRFISPYPEWPRKGSGSSLFTYLKNIVAHPSGERFAVFYVYFRKIRILNQDGTLEHEITVDFPEEFPLFDPEVRTNYLAYGSYPYATENYIAVICRNHRIADVPRPCSELQLWSWDGELLHRIILKEYLSVFTIDPSTSMLYACKLDDADHIYTADLSEYIGPGRL